MRVQLVDPSAFTPPYDRALAAALARAGAEVELVTTEFLHGEVPAADGYRVDERFYRRSASRGLAARGRLGFKLAEHLRDMLRFRRAHSDADVVHYQWLTLPGLDARLLPPTRPRVMTAHYILPPSPSRRQIASAHRVFGRMDAVVAHSEHGAARLRDEVGLPGERVRVIPHGAFDYLTELGAAEKPLPAELEGAEGPVILSFGLIRAYKGLEYLVAAFQQIAAGDNNYRLIIAGEPKKESQQYWRDIQRTIEREETGKRVIQEIRFVPDEETELYFKAADVLVLPYTEIFQSGVLFLAYGFGLPVIATDVGSLRDDIIEGQTGFVCRPSDAADLAEVLKKYFDSSLFHALDRKRGEIKAFARSRNSWNVVGDITRAVYGRLLAKRN